VKSHAFDRRIKDQDGRLRVSDCVLSAAVVSPYLGSELIGADGAQGLNLDPAVVYSVYRSASALRESVPTWEGCPLQIMHAPTSAYDPKKELIVGSVSNIRWQSPRLIGDLMVLDAEGIRGIEDNTNRDLSCGYRFSIAEAPGTAPDGTPYRFKMTKIIGNHVALVPEGRTPGCWVGDAAIGELTFEYDIAALVPNYNRLR
jgi:uncharacterized protein